MGRFVDVGQEATGFIAIGQVATGFFALGQIATGVIAIGQVARGFVVVGQASFGLVAIGMASGGLIGSVGMLGFGGRGWGGILPIVPRLREARELPPTLGFDELRASATGEGWVRGRLESDGARFAQIVAGGASLPVRIDARLRRLLPAQLGRELLAFVRRGKDGYVCDGLMELPPERMTQPRWWAIWAVQTGLLIVATVAFWYVVARPVLETLEKLVS